MNNGSKQKKFLIISIISFLLMSITFLIMPFGETDMNSGTSPLTIISGIIFWLCLIAAVVAQAILSNEFKKMTKDAKNVSERKIGIISFCQNKEGMAADICFLLSLITFIVLMLVTDGTMYFCYILMSMIVFSFCMHCIFNGKIYNTLFAKKNVARKNQKQEDK